MINASLRPLALNDLDNIMSWVNDQEVIGKFKAFAAPKTKDEEKQYLEKLLASETDKVFAIESETGKYIGNIGLHEIGLKHKIARIGIILGDKACWGKGYGQSAIDALLKIAFEEYSLKNVWLMCYATNTRIQHIAQKLGFRKEGILKNSYFHKGEYHEMVKMQLSKQDYLRRDKK